MSLSERLKSITPEMREKWKQERNEMRKLLTPEFQLGNYVGETIVNNHLPSLSTNGLHTRKVIEVSKEDNDENQKLSDEWYETTRYGGNYNKLDVYDKEKWNLYRQHSIMLENKYLPNPLVCYVDLLNIQDIDEFKRGLIQSLWDCDMCSYSLEKSEIKIYDDEDFYFTIIEFILDKDKETLK